MSRTRDALDHHAAFSAVVVAVVVGVVVAMTRRAVLGALVVGAAVVTAAALRLVLPEARAGLLVNRGRRTDALVLATVGTGLLALTLSLRHTYAAP